jgi:hypothetical protein
VEARKAGLLGVFSLALGTILPFIVGVTVALAFGYTDAVSVTTIGAGAITYIVGPVTGAALGAGSAVIALSIATGVLKAVIVMVGTPFVARMIGLDNPRSAMAFGGLIGTVSGVAGGLAAACPLWSVNSNISHGNRLPCRPFHLLSRDACTLRMTLGTRDDRYSFTCWRRGARASLRSNTKYSDR